MPDVPHEERAIVTVVEMARMVGLSRTRFRSLVAEGVFPPPRRNPETNRPFYDNEAQATCLRVRKTNCGINGKPILFYSRRAPSSPLPQRRPPPSDALRKRNAKPPTENSTEALVEGLRQLGLADVAEGKALEAVRTCFPNGHVGKPQGDVLLAVFRHLQRQN